MVEYRQQNMLKLHYLNFENDRLLYLLRTRIKTKVTGIFRDESSKLPLKISGIYKREQQMF